MATVSIIVNNRSYEVACADGQEPHLRRIGEFVDAKVRDLAESLGQIGDTRLLLMSSLLLADELMEIKQREGAGKGGTANGQVSEAALAEAMDRIADRIERIAARLEHT